MAFNTAGQDRNRFRSFSFLFLLAFSLFSSAFGAPTRPAVPSDSADKSAASNRLEKRVNEGNVAIIREWLQSRPMIGSTRFDPQKVMMYTNAGGHIAGMFILQNPDWHYYLDIIDGLEFRQLRLSTEGDLQRDASRALAQELRGDVEVVNPGGREIDPGSTYGSAERGPIHESMQSGLVGRLKYHHGAQIDLARPSATEDSYGNIRGPNGSPHGSPKPQGGSHPTGPHSSKGGNSPKGPGKGGSSSSSSKGSKPAGPAGWGGRG